MTARAGMANLITRLRSMVADPWRLYQETATGDGSGTVYWLSHNPQASGGTVSVGGTIQGTANYTWQTTYGKVSLVTAPANAALVSVEYLQAAWTDDDLQTVLDANVTLLESSPIKWLPDTIAGGTTAYFRAAIGWRDFEEAASGTVRWDLRDGTGAQKGTANYTPDYVGGYLTWTVDQAGSAYYLTARSYDLHSAAADIWLRKAAELSEQFQFTADGQSFHRQQAYQQAKEMAAHFRQRARQNVNRGVVQSNLFRRTDLNRSSS